ncbi:Peroxisomal membrane protein PAS20 [Rhizophlyctis rosea]|nr:Peroxisomal membrane protein PAS20 [Rhizophlyctis rosea]
MPSPAKPWERSANTPVPPIPSSSNMPSTGQSTPMQISAATSAAPPVPPRPATLATAGQSPYARPGYGTYNSYGGGYNSYGSTYNSYGSGYNAYGGGYNRFSPYSSYSSPYNRYSSPYNSSPYNTSPYNRYSPYAAYNPQHNELGEGPMPLSARLEQSTQSTFHLLDSIVQAFGGFAQMLESTFFATHSSFMAMVGVAEHLGQLRNYLGSALSMMWLIRGVRDWVTGRKVDGGPQAGSGPDGGLNADEFARQSSTDRRKSRGPMWLFVVLVVGIPYMVAKLMKRMQQRRLEAAAAAAHLGRNAEPHPHQEQLQHCRALYDFRGTSPAELTLRRGDVIRVLAKDDGWWRGVHENGAMGVFPANYVEVIPIPAPASAPASAELEKPKPSLSLDPATYDPDAIAVPKDGFN